MKSIFAQSVILLAVIGIALGRPGKFPCHGNKWSLGSSCEGPVLPSSLCSACPLKPVLGNGNFANCGQIYNLDAPACKNALQSYVQLNPCDAKRKQQVNDWNNWESKNGLDYFVYSICEQCCDCIPGGSKQSDYGPLSKTHTDNKPTLYKPERGNCPAHAFYDVCKIFPQVKYMRSPQGQTHPSWPKACPLLTQWFNSKNSANWANKDVSLSPVLKRFLNNLNVANTCKAPGVWPKCRNMEAAQGRIR